MASLYPQITEVSRATKQIYFTQSTSTKLNPPTPDFPSLGGKNS